MSQLVSISRRQFLVAASAAAAVTAVGCGTRAPKTPPEVNPSELLGLSAGDAVAALTRGEITAERYASALLAQCDLGKTLNAFITLESASVLDAAFSYKRILVTFAAFQHHIGFYPTPSAVKAFAKDLSKFATSEASIRFPLEKPLPLPLIRKITRFRVRESIEEDKKWKT